MKSKLFTLWVVVIGLGVAACQKLQPVSTKNADTQDPPITKAIDAAPSLGTLEDSAIYRIRGLVSLPNGPVVEVTGNTSTENAKIQQWPWFPNNGQKWRLIKTDSAWYKLVNVTSNKCLESPSATSGDMLQQGTDDGSDPQQWSIAYSGSNNIYSLTNKATGMKMVVDPENSTSGTKIRQDSTVTGTQDQFQFRNLEFQNPLTNNSRPDPYVAQKDGYYYFLCTKGNKITIVKTPSMSLLAAMPEITVWTPPAGTDHSSDIWAPELHFLNGKWYIYFAADSAGDVNHRMFVLENANADPTTKAWTFKGKIADSTDQYAIDGSVLTVGANNYFIWSGWESVATKYKQYIYLATMSDPWTISGPRIKISSPTNSWEKHEPSGSLGAGVNEGPIMLQKDGSSPVFVVFSASRYSGDYYCLGEIQLRSGGDPTVATDWINKKQVFVTNAAAGVYGPGHNGFFTSSYIDANAVTHTENWFVYHARSTPTTPTGARTPRMQQLTWNTDGSPNFGTATATGIKTPIPAGD